jgi:hypothetical protein
MKSNTALNTFIFRYKKQNLYQHYWICHVVASHYLVQELAMWQPQQYILYAYFFGTVVSMITDTTSVHAALNDTLQLADVHTQKVTPFPVTEIKRVLYTRLMSFSHPASLNDILHLAEGHTQKVTQFPVTEIKTVLYTCFVPSLHPAALNGTLQLSEGHTQEVTPPPVTEVKTIM